MTITCTLCGKTIVFTSVDTGGYKPPEHFDSSLRLDGKHVGTAYDDGRTWCASCEEDN
jgi:hypothetical protein